MSISISRRWLIIVVLVGVLLTAISSFVQIRSESYMGSSCMMCEDIVKTGTVKYMGAPVPFLAHYPSPELSQQTPPYSKFNGFMFVADILLWAAMIYVVIWLINHQKAGVVRRSK